MNLIGLGITIVTLVMMVAVAFWNKRQPISFRAIPAFRQIERAINLVVEDGSRLHVSLGRGNMLTPFGAAALAGLSMLRKLGEVTAMSDNPPVATSGDGVLNLVAQDTLRTAHEAVAKDKPFDMNRGSLTGLSPFSYAAGAIPTIYDEQVSTNVLVGNYGVEVGLLTDAADREGSAVVAASDNLPAQAVLYAATPGSLVGEELFAAGAYYKAGDLHAASLLVQDILRWLIILAMLLGAIVVGSGLMGGA